MKINAAEALAGYVDHLSEDKIIPNPLDKNVANIIADSMVR
jgi:malic enzyme